MEKPTGFEIDAVAFIAFMFMLSGLELAWSTAGMTHAAVYNRAGVSESIIASSVAIKPGPPEKQVVPAAKAVVQKPADTSPDAGKALAVFFRVRGCSYPPRRVTFIAVKDEGRLEVWAAGADGPPKYIMEYPICATSGIYGPKLRRGDRQVPEGLYSISGLNPYSRYHLSLRIDYPNAFDRKMAASDGRCDLGGDIFIHGDCRSRGCIAMGDAVIEELYALVRDTGTDNTSVIIAPWDFRKWGHAFRLPPELPEWTPQLYEKIDSAMAVYAKSGA